MPDRYAALRNVKAKHGDGNECGERINPEEPPCDERSKQMFRPFLVLPFQRLHQHEGGMHEEQIYPERTKRQEDVAHIDVKTSHVAANNEEHSEASEEV
jgi:hypothetical protein